MSETFTLTTNSTGTVLTDWIRKVPDGNYVASILSIEMPPLVWNAGMGETDAFHQVLHALNAVSRFSGDVTQDGMVTAEDIDALHAAIRNQIDDSIYDLNEDGEVDGEDSAFLIETLLNTFVGDANLDGEFTSRDLVLIFSAGEYEDRIERNSGWASGDWNGDGDFTTGDLVAAFRAGGYDAGPRPQAARIGLIDAVFANERFQTQVAHKR